MSSKRLEFDNRRMHPDSYDPESDDHSEIKKVVYWMSRDQRIADNWAYFYAHELASITGADIEVVFSLAPGFLGATLRHYDFMLQGLQAIERSLNKSRIRFKLLTGSPDVALSRYLSPDIDKTIIVTDYSPLRISRQWKNELRRKYKLVEIDTHNIIPPWVTSEKQEYAARTIRPKIHKLLDEWLVEPPGIPESVSSRDFKESQIDWVKVFDSLEVDRSVEPVDWIEPGEGPALDSMRSFFDTKLEQYEELRNKPLRNHLSHLSPYLHFGHLSPQRVAFEALKYKDLYPEGFAAYFEELVVRRELAENYCHYCVDYDNHDGFPQWAQETLSEHNNDDREYLYTIDQLEEAKTHDDLWNAAQLEMVDTGKMHGYMRMYWCKKILEWTTDSHQAQEFAIYLNDKYELDGRDPNGYVGIAWSIGGVHDQGWKERPIFGKIRYMSRQSTGRKFDSKGYIAKYTGQQELLSS